MSRASRALRARVKAATITFSTTVMRGKGRDTWKVLPTPRAQMVWGMRPVMRLPSNHISPRSGLM